MRAPCRTKRAGRIVTVVAAARWSRTTRRMAGPGTRRVANLPNERAHWGRCSSSLCSTRFVLLRILSGRPLAGYRPCDFTIVPAHRGQPSPHRNRCRIGRLARPSAVRSSQHRFGWSTLWRLACVIGAARIAVLWVGSAVYQNPTSPPGLGYMLLVTGLPEIYLVRGARARPWQVVISC